MIVHNSVVRGAISTADSFESFTTSITDPRNIDNDFSLLTRERIDLFRLAEGDVDFLPEDERIRDSSPFAWSDDSNEDGSATSNSSGGSSLGGVSVGGNYPPVRLHAPTEGLAAQAAAVPLPPASPDELEQLLGFFIDTSDAESVQNAVDLPGLVIDDEEEELNEIYSVDMNSVGANSHASANTFTMITVSAEMLATSGFVQGAVRRFLTNVRRHPQTWRADGDMQNALEDLISCILVEHISNAERGHYETQDFIDRYQQMEMVGKDLAASGWLYDGIAHAHISSPPPVPDKPTDGNKFENNSSAATAMSTDDDDSATTMDYMYDDDPFLCANLSKGKKRRHWDLLK